MPSIRLSISSIPSWDYSCWPASWHSRSIKSSSDSPHLKYMELYRFSWNFFWTPYYFLAEKGSVMRYYGPTGTRKLQRSWLRISQLYPYTLEFQYPQQPLLYIYTMRLGTPAVSLILLQPFLCIRLRRWSNYWVNRFLLGSCISCYYDFVWLWSTGTCNHTGRPLDWKRRAWPWLQRQL